LANKESLSLSHCREEKPGIEEDTFPGNQQWYQARTGCLTCIEAYSTSFCKNKELYLMLTDKETGGMLMSVSSVSEDDF
jgi:hypothetical protein